MSDSNEVRGKASFFKKNDLSYRKFSSHNVEHGRIFVQLIVPQQYRSMVINWQRINYGRSSSDHYSELFRKCYQNSFRLELLVILKDFFSLAIFANALYLS